MSEKEYKWIVPEEVPYWMIAKRRKEYDECIKEFLDSGLESARVNIPDVKPKSLARTLSNRIKKKGLKGKIRVGVRGDKVFLIRIKPQ